MGPRGSDSTTLCTKSVFSDTEFKAGGNPTFGRRRPADQTTAATKVIHYFGSFILHNFLPSPRRKIDHVPLLDSERLRHFVVPAANIRPDEIEYSLERWNQYVGDVINPVNLLATAKCPLAPAPKLRRLTDFWNASSGGTALSASLVLGSPTVITYGTLSPYWGSSFGSTARRRAATIAPGGGAPLSLYVPSRTSLAKMKSWTDARLSKIFSQEEQQYCLTLLRSWVLKRILVHT